MITFFPQKGQAKASALHPFPPLAARLSTPPPATVTQSRVCICHTQYVRFCPMDLLSLIVCPWRKPTRRAAAGLLLLILQHSGRPVVKHVGLIGLRRQRLLLQRHSNLIAGLLLHSSDPPVETAVVHPLLQNSDPNAEGVNSSARGRFSDPAVLAGRILSQSPTLFRFVPDLPMCAIPLRLLA